MYFSLITPVEDRMREAAHARNQGPYAEHQWLWRFFPAPEGTPRDFLFRRSEDARGIRYYVVSAREPTVKEDAWQVHSKPYAPVIEAGQRLSFEVRVNPVVTTERDGKSRRDDVVMDRKKKLLAERGLARWNDWKTPDRPAEHDLVSEVCTGWLCGEGKDGSSRASRGGFRVDPRALSADAYVQYRDGRKGIQFSSVDLSGELEVTDVPRFLGMLSAGLGRGRAFGCGLMLVRPA
ncbi:MAG: type I-E CRISPR-associated protein Cas6/Cse3/CasE [Pseudomonadota bacterium]